MNSTKIKHVISDVDGTLIYSRNNRPVIDKRLITEINRLYYDDFGFSIATGRHYKDILEMMNKKNVNYMNYIIGMAGSQIYDFNEQKIIYDKFFNDDEVRKFYSVYEYMKKNFKNQFVMAIYSKNQNENDSINYINDSSDLFVYYIEQYLPRMCTNVEYLEYKICRTILFNKIYKVVFNFFDCFKKENKHFQRIKNELDEVFKFDFDFVECGPSYVEMCMKGIDKGSAIKYLVDNKFIKSSYDQLLCFGDSDNDIPMFQLIDNSVTRKTAPESIKKHAKHIFDSNPSEFVLEGIKKFVYNE